MGLKFARHFLSDGEHDPPVSIDDLIGCGEGIGGEREATRVLILKVVVEPFVELATADRAHLIEGGLALETVVVDIVGDSLFYQSAIDHKAFEKYLL